MPSLPTETGFAGMAQEERNHENAAHFPHSKASRSSTLVL